MTISEAEEPLPGGWLREYGPDREGAMEFRGWEGIIDFLLERGAIDERELFVPGTIDCRELDNMEVLAVKGAIEALEAPTLFAVE